MGKGQKGKWSKRETVRFIACSSTADTRGRESSGTSEISEISEISEFSEISAALNAPKAESALGADPRPRHLHSEDCSQIMVK